MVDKVRRAHAHFVQSLAVEDGGGLATATVALHDAMLGQGLDSKVISTTGQFSALETSNCFLYPSTGPRRVFYSRALSQQASFLLKEPSFVHAHGLYTFTNWTLGNKAIDLGKDLVTHIHGIFDPWILKRSRLKKAVVNFLFQTRQIERSLFLRALTYKEADQIKKLGFKAPVEVIPNGVGDLPSIVPELPAEYTRVRPKRLLFLSRIHPKKGLFLLLNAWGKLAPQFRDWELLIVGPGESNYVESLYAKITSADIRGSCRIMPPVTGDLKTALFFSADLFVLPSFSEGFPMVLLEAIQHGVPIVGTTECNLTELSEIGWECIPDEDSLCKTLTTAMHSCGIEAADRAARARTLLAEKYNLRQIAIAVHDACISRHRPRY